MNKKVLKWNFIFQYGYVLTNIFNSIILLPLYLKHIDATTLGIWLATGNILAWITLTDPGVGEVLQQKIAQSRGQKLYNEVSETIGSGLIASGIILVMSVLVGFVFYFLLGVIINKDVSQYPNLQVAFVLSIVATGMSLVSFSVSGINQGLHNSANVAIASMLANVVFLLLNITFLYLDYGLISIAFANLCRSLFINVYNVVSMNKVLSKENIKIRYNLKHFKSFIKIFSFTSASKIISGFSGSIDMIILARFIPASMITVYEINKRPISMTQGLIGRHSVALMPLISHAKGKDDTPGIISFINSQFRIYTYAALFTALMFWLTHQYLISLWTGSNQYAGDTILLLLLANFFIGLIGYFMSNMGYALGDIKMNSLINIIKGITIAVLMFLVAGKYGIKGTLVVWIIVTVFADFFYFTFRLYKLGYLQISLLKNIATLLALIIPASFLLSWASKTLVDYMFAEHIYLAKIFVSASLFTASFLIILLAVDSEIRNSLKGLKEKFFLSAFYKSIRA